MKKALTFTLALSALASTQAEGKKFTPTHQKDISTFAPQTLEIQKRFSQTDSLASIIPQKMKAGQNGYLILTTNAVRDNSKKLKDFIAHKKSLGFNVSLATEDQFGLTKEGKGRKQADKVRAWLQGVYKERKLLYTLIIDNPHPDEGVIPMAKFKPRKYKVAQPEQKKDYAKYLKYKDNPRTEDGKYLLFDGSDPSDYYYADLDSVWDANGNSILADKEDYASGKINCVADVYVGRLPYMGEDSEYGKISDLDILLQRTIDYENDTSDQSWKKNLFYVGGADKRWNKITSYFTAFSGGKIESYRKSRGAGFEPTATSWHGGRITEELNGDRAYGFINFQEHGSWNSMAGQISNKSAATLKRTKPAYIYLGGCDVNSPEHPTNVTYTLFRYAGIGAAGATRSVTSVGGDDDTEAIAGYARLFFGQSQGEAHWRMLSDFADGKGKVGASNFLMNLWGDPSVVVMPYADKSSVLLSPNMDVLKFRHQYRSADPAGYDFTIRNTSGRSMEYKVKYSKELLPKIRTFRLAPNATKTLPVNFRNGDKISVGKHSAKFEVIAQDGKVERRNLELDVYGRNILLTLGFNDLNARKLVGFDAKNEKREMLNQFVKDHASDDFVTLPKGCRADLNRTKVVIGSNSGTIVGKFRFNKKPNKRRLVFFEFGKTFKNFNLEIQNGKLRCIFSTLGIVETDPGTEAIVETEIPEAGKWHQFVAIADRKNKELRFILNGAIHKTAFDPKPGQGIQFERLRLGYGKNQQDVMVDDLSIYDYVLTPSEINDSTSGRILQQTFPKNADFANPNGVNLAWKSGIKGNPTYIVALASNPQFKDVKFTVVNDNTTVLKGLENNQTYYWKVGLKENGKASFPWKSFSTFTTDDKLEDYPITIRPRINIKPATVGDNGFTIKLSKFARATGKLKPNGKPDKVELFFAKVSGDDWLRCHPDGTLTTNHGAPAAKDYEFEFSVSTRYGQPKTFKVTIPAK